MWLLLLLLLLLLHHSSLLYLRVAGCRQLARRHGHLGLQQVLDAAGDGRSDGGLQLRRDDGAGRAGLHLHHARQRGGRHGLGGQLGHGRHVAGEALRHARRGVRLQLRRGDRRGTCRGSGLTARTQLRRQDGLLLLLLLLLLGCVLLLRLASWWRHGTRLLPANV